MRITPKKLISNYFQKDLIMKKYELTENVISFTGITLHQIRALRDFGNVKAGDLGGYVESEKNLSHDGNAWIFNNAMVFNNATVGENAAVSGYSRVFDNASISGYAIVMNHARIFGNAAVRGNARILHDAWIFDNATVGENAEVSHDAMVFGFIKLSGNTKERGTKYKKFKPSMLWYGLEH